jgi:hypothetical protein
MAADSAVCGRPVFCAQKYWSAVWLNADEQADAKYVLIKKNRQTAVVSFRADKLRVKPEVLQGGRVSN